MGLGIFYSFLTALFFSISGMFVKIIYNNYSIGENLLFLAIMFFSFLYYFVIFTLNKKTSFKDLKIDKRNFILATVNGGLFCLVLTNMFTLASFKYIDIGIQRAIAFSSPVIIVIIQRLFLGRKIDLKEGVSICLMVLGLLLVIGKVNLSSESSMVLGLFLAFMAALMFSLYSIVSESKKYTISETIFWIYSYATATIAMAIIMLFTGEIRTVNMLFNAKFALYLFILSLFYSSLPYYFFNIAIKKIGASKSNMGLALTPIISLFLGVVFLNNSVNIVQIVGFTLVILSLVLVSMQTDNIKVFAKRIFKK